MTRTHLKTMPFDSHLLRGLLVESRTGVVRSNGRSSPGGVPGRADGALLPVEVAIRGWQSGVGLTGVEGCAIRAIGLGIRGAAVDVVSLGHRSDLVVGELRQLLGNDGGSSFGEVGVGENDIEFFQSSGRQLTIL